MTELKFGHYASILTRCLPPPAAAVVRQKAHFLPNDLELKNTNTVSILKLVNYNSLYYGVYKLLGVKGLQIFQALTQAHKINGQPKFAA